MPGVVTMSEQFYAKVARLFPYGISKDTVADASKIRAIIDAAGEICRVGDEALGQRVGLARLKLEKIAAELFAEGRSDHAKIGRLIKILCDLDGDKSKPPGAL